MTEDYGVPFDDIYAPFAPAWYQQPYFYVVIAGFIVTGMIVWMFLRRRRRMRVHHERKKVMPVRTPEYWKDKLYDIDSWQEQAYMYADYIRYLKHVAQQCYTENNTAMTDSEFVAWGQNNLSYENAQHIKTIVQHAEYVRFKGQVVDAATRENDYMFVNELATSMQSRDS